jgi:predicted small lipoprotein YifL
MIMRRTRLGYLFLLATLGLALATGCGRKGPVRPERQPLPAAPEEFSLRQQGDRMVLVWSLPRFNQDGTPLTDLDGFKIMRMEFDPAEDCPNCRDTSELRRQVDLGFLRDVQQFDDRFFLADGDLRVGFGYQYRIIPYNRWGQDGPSVMQRATITALPPAPAAVTADSADGVLTLAWQPPADLPADMELLGYNVYRRRPGRAMSPAPLNRAPVTTLRYADRAFRSGRTYLYAVRAVVRHQGRTVESLLSRAVVATPWSSGGAL